MRINRLIILSLILCIGKSSFAQFRYGIDEVSVSAANVVYGLPFIRFAPMRLGIETGIAFLINDKIKSKQKISADIGTLFHDLVGNSVYLNATYNYQYKTKQTIGLSGYAGIGYAHVFYPGSGYLYNPQSGNYESHQVNQAFLLTNASIAASYIKFDKIQPFIKYGLMLFGFDTQNVITSFHIGVHIKINNSQMSKQ